MAIDSNDVSNLVNAGSQVYQTFGGGGGGRVDCRGRHWCDGRPEDWQITTVLMLATDSELQPIIVGWPGSGRPGATTTPLRQADPCEVGYWLWGHADCRHSGPTGDQQKARMIQLVSKYAGNALTTGTTGGTQTPGSYYPPPPAPGTTAPNPAATQTATNPTSQVQSIWDGVKNFFRGILGGALGGASNAEQAGGTASVASGSGILTLLLIGVVVYLLLKD